MILWFIPYNNKVNLKKVTDIFFQWTITSLHLPVFSTKTNLTLQSILSHPKTFHPMNLRESTRLFTKILFYLKINFMVNHHTMTPTMPKTAWLKKIKNKLSLRDSSLSAMLLSKGIQVTSMTTLENLLNKEFREHPYQGIMWFLKESLKEIATIMQTMFKVSHKS